MFDLSRGNVDKAGGGRVGQGVDDGGNGVRGGSSEIREGLGEKRGVMRRKTCGCSRHELHVCETLFLLKKFYAIKI